MKIDNYYLDLNALKELSERDQEIIHDYYKNMLYSYHDGRMEMAISFMLTLLNGGFLLDNRNEKIKNILDEQ